MEARSVIRFRSIYALRLYELGCLMFRRSNPSVHLTVAELREKFGVPTEAYASFTDLRRRVLEQARKELEQVAPFKMSWEEQTVSPRSRVVKSIQLNFLPKEPMHTA